MVPDARACGVGRSGGSADTRPGSLSLASTGCRARAFRTEVRVGAAGAMSVLGLGAPMRIGFVFKVGTSAATTLAAPVMTAFAGVVSSVATCGAGFAFPIVSLLSGGIPTRLTSGAEALGSRAVFAGKLPSDAGRVPVEPTGLSASLAAGIGTNCAAGARFCASGAGGREPCGDFSVKWSPSSKAAGRAGARASIVSACRPICFESVGPKKESGAAGGRSNAIGAPMLLSPEGGGVEMPHLERLGELPSACATWPSFFAAEKNCLSSAVPAAGIWPGSGFTAIVCCS